MQWTDVKVTTLKKYENICEMIGGEICPAGIQIEDYSDLEQEVLNIAHIDLIDEELINKDRDKIIVHHYISPQRDAQDIILQLENALSVLEVEYSISLEYVNQEDWENSWKAYYKPMDIGEKLAVCPSWIDYKTNRVTLKLDPGMAFGSGTHETTYLCLEVLDKYLNKGDRVLDIGTGSGILGIGAALLGAKSVEGVEIDPTAVKVAKENSILNNTQDVFKISQGDLTKNTSGTYDIIVANIVANAIIMLTKDVRRLISETGLYITSGIIIERETDVVNALKENGFKIKEILRKNNWVCIIATL